MNGEPWAVGRNYLNHEQFPPEPYAHSLKGSLTDLITGTSDKGFGSEVAVTLATAKPKLLILASRNEAKVSPVIDAIKAIDPTVEAAFLHLDLLHNASVRAAVTQIKTLTSRVDGLVNNAGIMAPRTYAASKDGVESQFATNYLSHFLLTNLLLKEGLVGGEREGGGFHHRQRFQLGIPTRRGEL